MVKWPATLLVERGLAMRHRFSARMFLPLAAAAWLMMPERAAAQLVRVTIGAPRDFSTSTGHGNYPGSDGFVPGYGYYPEWLKDPAIVIDGPRFRPTRYVAVPVEPILPPAPAVTVLRVRVPDDADVLINGDRTAQRGAERRFVTPPLESGRKLHYEIRARWKERGEDVERIAVVPVRPGERLALDFLAPPSMTADNGLPVWLPRPE
jgi:uncharacterized protein (TIGR03000 family)